MDVALRQMIDRVNRIPHLRSELRDEFCDVVKLTEVNLRAAANQMRLLLETVIKAVYRREINEPTSRVTLDQMIGEGKSKGKIPQKLSGYAMTIKEIGNIGSHAVDERLELKDLVRALDMLVEILDWHAEQCRPAGAAVAGTAEPPPQSKVQPAIRIASRSGSGGRPIVEDSRPPTPGQLRPDQSGPRRHDSTHAELG